MLSSASHTVHYKYMDACIHNTPGNSALHKSVMEERYLHKTDVNAQLDDDKHD